MSERPKGAPASVPAAGGYEGDSAPWPVEIRLEREAARLEIDFDDGRSFGYPAEYLRVESPSAAAVRTVASASLSAASSSGSARASCVSPSARAEKIFCLTVPVFSRPPWTAIARSLRSSA